MRPRALSFALLAVLALVETACFDPTYDGDVSFACDSKEQAAQRCPGGFHCVPDDGRCHRTCSGPAECSAGSDCVDRGGVKVCWPRQTPGPDGGVDGQVADGPLAQGCHRWEHLGKLAAVGSDAPFAVAVDQQGRAHVVHLDNEGHVVERFETAGGWQARQITALANTSQVAAAVDSNNQLHFVYSSAKGPVQHCTKAANNDAVICSKESTLSVGPLGSVKSISGLDLSAAPTGGWLALAVTLETQGGQSRLVYASVVPDPSGFVYSWKCNDDAAASHPRRGPRITAGADFAVASFYLDDPASQQWQVVHFPKAAGPDNGASCQGLPALTVPRSTAARLPLVIEQGQVHAARGLEPDVQHLFWPLATFEITAPSEVVFSGAFAAGSLDLAAVGDLPVVSGVIGEGTAFAPPVVWFKAASGWTALSLPTQPPAQGAGAGALTRMAADPASGAIHLVHDGVDQDADPALFYLRCRLPAP